MRSDRFVPVSDILPCISATVISPNYTTTLSAEQLSGLLGHNPSQSAKFIKTGSARLWLVLWLVRIKAFKINGK